MLTKFQKQQGFTLIEVAVVVPMIVIIVLGILSLLVILVRTSVTQSTQSGLVNDVRYTLGTIEKDVDSSSLFFPDVLPSTVYRDFNEPGLSGSYKTNGTLVSGTTSTDLNSFFIQGFNQIVDPQDSTGTKVIAAFKGAAPCSGIAFAQVSNISPLAILYFVKNGTLYRRTLVDRTNPAVCGTGPLIKQACPTGNDGNNPQCLRKDEALLAGVSKFKIDYYQNAGDATAINAYQATPSPTIDQAEAVVVTIAASASANGTRVNHSVSLRMTRAND